MGLEDEISGYLTSKQTKAICLVYESGLEEKATAEEMQCVKRVLNKHLHAAFKKLKRDLPDVADRLRASRPTRIFGTERKERPPAPPLKDDLETDWDCHIDTVKRVVNYLLSRRISPRFDRRLLEAEGNFIAVEAVARGNPYIYTTVKNGLLNYMRDTGRREMLMPGGRGSMDEAGNQNLDALDQVLSAYKDPNLNY